jgi:histone deacetylase 1/2
MKPHRIRMTHNLISNYGLCDEYEYDAPHPEGEGARVVNDITQGMDEELEDAVKWERRVLAGPRGRAMQVFVSGSLPTHPHAADMHVQRPRRATKTDMTKFHTDEYIDLLEAVTPETADAMTGGGIRCGYAGPKTTG